MIAVDLADLGYALAGLVGAIALALAFVHGATSKELEELDDQGEEAGPHRDRPTS